MTDATSGKTAFITPGFLSATVLVVALFFFWGVSNSLNDVLIPQFRKTFLLSDFTSSLVQFATFIGYFVFAIPASLFMRRFGYRAAVVMGLVLFGTGALLFYPAAELGEYHWFLAALFVVASGLSFLETSANPMIAVMGPPESADQRLNFAQAFNPLGNDRRRVRRQDADPVRTSPDARGHPRDGAGGAGRLARERARRRQTTLPRHRLRGAHLGAAGRRSRNFPPWRGGWRRTMPFRRVASAAFRSFRATGSACSRSSRTWAHRWACGAS